MIGVTPSMDWVIGERGAIVSPGGDTISVGGVTIPASGNTGALSYNACQFTTVLLHHDNMTTLMAGLS